MKEGPEGGGGRREKGEGWGRGRDGLKEERREGKV